MTDICIPRKFTFEEANEMIPLFQKLTTQREASVQRAMKHKQYFIQSGASIDRIRSCDIEVAKLMVAWGNKLTKLGAMVYTGDYVSLDAGGHFWSWRPGEPKIEYYYYYSENPMSRRKIQTILLPEGVPNDQNR